MRIEATHAGRNGDILWSMPVVRAIAAAYGEPVHLTIPSLYGELAPLLAQQPYIGSVLAREDWVVKQTAPITPRTPPQGETSQRGVDRTFHLGYVGWPGPTLPEDVYDRCAATYAQGGGRQLGDPELPALDLTTPWLTAPAPKHSSPLSTVIGFSDEHFELKVGLVTLLSPSLPNYVIIPPGRWATEYRNREEMTDDWIDAANRIAGAKVFFGCCSALHVLAVGLGVPAVVMEPNAHRLHPTFWPCGQDGSQVRLVRGNDGLSTFDARHCAESLRAALGR